jgi:hypothetical protein
MCNLYSVTTNQEAIRALFRVMNRYAGNQPRPQTVGFPFPSPGVAHHTLAGVGCRDLGELALESRRGGPAGGPFHFGGCRR